MTAAQALQVAIALSQALLLLIPPEEPLHAEVRCAKLPRSWAGSIVVRRKGGVGPLQVVVPEPPDNGRHQLQQLTVATDDIMLQMMTCC
jgi:hypothetical protein